MKNEILEERNFVTTKAFCEIIAHQIFPTTINGLIRKRKTPSVPSVAVTSFQSPPSVNSLIKELAIVNRKGHVPAGDGYFDKCGDNYRWRLKTKEPLTSKTRVKTIKAKMMRKLQKKGAAWKIENAVDEGPYYDSPNVDGNTGGY